jgi:hypothetical protein
MPVENLQKDTPLVSIQARSETRFPAYSLLDALKVAEVIHKRAGGRATVEHITSYLGYRSANNGSYLGRMSAARSFGWIEKHGDQYAPSGLALLVLTPVYDVDAKKALVDAFLNVPLYKRIYDDFRNKELPPAFGMKNALRNVYGVLPTRVELAYKVLIDSAEQAGFFEVRGGARTHLIIPAFAPGKAKPINAETSDSHPTSGGNGGGDGGGDDPDRNENFVRRLREDSGANLGDVKAKYVSTLIKLFEEKSAKGDLDEKLMERIERLLGAA